MTPARRAGVAAVLWGAAEATLFFVVPDVLIGWIALHRGLRAGVRAALLAAFGAALGGAVMFAWSARAPASARAAVEAVPAVSPAMIDRAGEDMERRGWLAASLRGPLTSTPYKVYAMLAPQAGAGLPAFAAGALPVRLPRFLAVVLAFTAAGALIRPRFAPRWLTAIYAGGWFVFYGWFWASHAG